MSDDDSESEENDSESEYEPDEPVRIGRRGGRGGRGASRGIRRKRRGGSSDEEGGSSSGQFIGTLLLAQWLGVGEVAECPGSIRSHFFACIFSSYLSSGFFLSLFPD